MMIEIEVSLFLKVAKEDGVFQVLLYIVDAS